ncbi:hypothetical protein AC1031_005927 [Aphanomyces cochlioides]|nr:hypothetical protein AC1031_005927 [Aphanomyces cochlioides]
MVSVGFTEAQVAAKWKAAQIGSSLVGYVGSMAVESPAPHLAVSRQLCDMVTAGLMEEANAASSWVASDQVTCEITIAAISIGIKTG